MKTINRSLLALAALLLLFYIPGGALHADGFIIIPRPPHPLPPTPFPLEVTFHKVTVAIRDQIAITSVDQEFHNPNSQRLEGYYLFPVPVHAVIKRFSMEIDGRDTPAELLDAAKARTIYEEIVRTLRDPALLEYSRQGVFRVRVFPIEPHASKRIRISYQELLNREDATTEYLYPLNTEKFSAQPLKRVSIQMTVDSSLPLKNIYCPTHQTEIKRNGERQARISYESRDETPDRDFKLYFSTEMEKLGISLLSFQKENEDGYFYLVAGGGLDRKQSGAMEKDIAFVLDCSGSMAGPNLRQAQKALLFCLENLNHGDRFNIVRFSTEAESLFAALTPAGEESRRKARQFVQGLQAIGGTNMEEALKIALAERRDNARPFLLVFITDGRPTIGETDEERLVQMIGDINAVHTRIFTFGIGNDINTHLLDKITELTRAYRSYISPEEDIEVKISNFYNKIQSPVLTDLRLDVSGPVQVNKLYPRNLPDLFHGSQLTLLGRFRGRGKARLTLSGLAGGKREEYACEAEFGVGETRNDFIPPLWAARRIGFLLDTIRLKGENKELIDEIVQLARTHGIVTPYTSYLILEDEQRRLRIGEIREADAPLSQLAARDRELESKSKEEYGNLARKTGSPSVQASREVQELSDAFNVSQSRPGEGRMNLQNGKGKQQNLSQLVRNAGGRAFYQTGDIWIDSRLQGRPSGKTERIPFASEDYFQLLRENPGISPILSLGRNLRFAVGNRMIEIYE